MKRDVAGIAMPVVGLAVSLPVIFAPRFGFAVSEPQQMTAAVVATFSALALILQKAGS